MDRGWNVVERENEGHSQSQLYHEVSPASLAFSHQRYDLYPIFHPHLYNYLFAMIFSVRPNVAVFVSTAGALVVVTV